MRIELAEGTRARVMTVIAVYLAGAALVAVGAHSSTGADTPDSLRYVTLGVVCGAMLLRRRAPMLGLAIGSLGFLVETAFALSLGTALAYSDNLYAAAAHGPRRAGPIMLVGGAIVISILSGIAYVAGGVPAAVVIGAVMTMLLLSPIGTGLIIRESRTRAEAEKHRAEAEAQRAETIVRLAEADQEALIAAERNRMARELHDTIANHFSAIAFQSSAIQSRSDMDDGLVRQIVGDIRQSSLDGLSEVRRTIEFLRTGEAEDTIRHGIADIVQLVKETRDDGLDIVFHVSGQDTTLPPAVGFAAFRIAQEAMINARKHGCDADLTLTVDEQCLTIILDNVVRIGEPAPGTASGLIGMRERAELLGGRFSSGLTPQGRWRLTAHLPIGSANDQDESETDERVSQ